MPILMLLLLRAVYMNDDNDLLTLFVWRCKRWGRVVVGSPAFAIVLINFLRASPVYIGHAISGCVCHTDFRFLFSFFSFFFWFSLFVCFVCVRMCCMRRLLPNHPLRHRPHPALRHAFPSIGLSFASVCLNLKLFGGTCSQRPVLV